MFLRREALGLLVVCSLALVLGVRFQDTVRTSLFESGVRAVLNRYFGGSSEFRVVSVDFSKSGHDTVVRAVVRGPKQPSATEVADAQAHLPATSDGTSVRLRVRFVQIAIVTPQGPILDDEGDDHESENAR